MTRKTRCTTLAAMISALALVGCASDSTSTMGMNCMDPADGDAIAAGSVNSVCPIGGDGVGKGSPLVVHKGTTIALCCDGCVTKWDAMSEAERDDVREQALAQVG